VCALEGGHELIIHLGMTGVLQQHKPTSHGRVQLMLSDETSVYFRDTRRFGRFCVAIDGDRSLLPTLHQMGPEPLSNAFTVDAFQRRLTSRSAIKTVLLSQRPVAGVGNIYADEALWRAYIRPSKSAKSLGPKTVTRLHRAINVVMEQAIQAGGTTIRDFQTGSGQQGNYGANLMVYGRGGQPCVRCTEQLSKCVIGQRTTVYCGKCQR